MARLPPPRPPPCPPPASGARSAGVALRALLLAAPLGAALLLGGCASTPEDPFVPGGNDGPATMNPGEDCERCHAGAFSLGGTVYATSAGGTGVYGAVVVATGADGKAAQTTSNSAGNFHLVEPLAFPLRSVSLTRNGVTRVMNDVPSGACNGCHAAAGEPGRIFVR